MVFDKSTVIQNAQKYTAKGQLDKAIEEWQKLIAETPNDGNIYNTIGDLHLKNNSPKEAIEVYLKAAEAYNRAGFALKTIAVYKKIIKIDPQRMEAYVKLADLHAERGLTGNAIEDYMKVAKHYAKEGKVRESLEIYRKIANLDPTNVNIQIKLSELCLKEGLRTEALEGLLKSAQNCSAQGKNKEAEALYARVLQIDPKNEVARSHVKETSVKETSVSGGITLPKSPADRVVESPPVMAQGDSDQGEGSLREILKKPEATTAQRQQLGYLLLKKGDLEGALHEFQQVVQEYHQEQLWGPAIQVMQDYLQKDPKRIEAHELLAQSYEKSRVIDRAIEEYVTVIDLMIREEHSMTEAMEHFKRIRDLDPQNPIIEKLKVRFGAYTEPPSKSSMSGREASFPSPAAISSPGVETSASGGKETIQSYLTEAEVYLKYGLSGKALEQLQTAVKIAPDHPEVHLRLKEVYRLEGKISGIVEECLELARIYAQNQKPDQRRQVLEEALALAPDNAQVKLLLDPSSAQPSLKVEPQMASERSQSRRSIGDPISMSQSAQNRSNISQGPKESNFEVLAKEKIRSESSKSKKPESEPISIGQSKRSVDHPVSSGHPLDETSLGPQKLSPEASREVEERFAEAEFYLQQGLKQEAKQLYQKVLSIKPSHFQAQTRLSELQLEQSDHVADVEPAEPVKASPPPPQPQGPKLQMPAQEEGDVNLAEMFMDELEDKAKPEEAEPVKSAPVDPAQQELEALFREFKKGVQEQFGDQDYETRYNLGIAYKEMGLVKEAIDEFKLASKGQNLFIDAIHMTAVCYKEVGEYEQAAQQLLSALGDERCSGGHAIGIKYELAQLYELMDRKKEAFELYTEIYEMDKSFKDVAQKLKDLKKEAAPDMVQAGAKTRRPQEYIPKEKPVKKKKVSYL